MFYCLTQKKGEYWHLVCSDKWRTLHKAWTLISWFIILMMLSWCISSNDVDHSFKYGISTKTRNGDWIARLEFVHRWEMEISFHVWSLYTKKKRWLNFMSRVSAQTRNGDWFSCIEFLHKLDKVIEFHIWSLCINEKWDWVSCVESTDKKC